MSPWPRLQLPPPARVGGPREGWGGRGDWPDGRLIEVPVGRPPLRWTHPLAAHLGRHHCCPRAGEKEVGHWVSPDPGPRPTPGPRPHPPCAVRSASEASISPLLGRRVKGTVADLRLMSAAATMQQQCSNDAATMLLRRVDPSAPLTEINPLITTTLSFSPFFSF